MKTKFNKLNICISVVMFLALVVGMAVPMQTARANLLLHLITRTTIMQTSRMLPMEPSTARRA